MPGGAIHLLRRALPELYRYLIGAGADLLMIPAAFTAFTGKDHWQVLLKHGQSKTPPMCWLLPKQVSITPAAAAMDTMVIDPWGTVLADAGDQIGAAIAPVNTDHLGHIRDQMPSLRHRQQALF